MTTNNFSPSLPLVDLVSVSTSDVPDTYTSSSLWMPCGARGVFGGQVIAQALSAASHTVALPLGLHSQHCYFVLPAAVDPPISYRVERVRDGRSYATRLVRAVQAGKEVFVLIASYTTPPIGLPPPIRPPADNGTADDIGKLSHELRFALGSRGSGVGAETGSSRTSSKGTWSFRPRWALDWPVDVVPWEECEEEEVRWQRVLDEKGQGIKGKARTALVEYIAERKSSPVGIAAVRRKGKRHTEADRHRRMIWLRARISPGALPDSAEAREEIIKAMIAYVSDFQFIGTASRSLGLTRASTPRLGMLASLDHSTHFYPFPPGFRGDEPLLHVMEAAVADVSTGRGFVRGLVYTRQGVLVAVTNQEGVVRVDLPRERKAKL